MNPAISTLAAAAFACLPVAGYANCVAQSTDKTAALVELYTSEGCSSCPPADRQMGELQKLLDPGARAVPVALHVDYWDYLGWKDPYGQAAFAARQTWLVQANRQRTLYTPQFFVSGAELRSLHRSLREEVRRVNALPAAARISIAVKEMQSDGFIVSADAAAPAARDSLALYLAIAETSLRSDVIRGENAGATLAHDHVVRQWLAPAAFHGGSASVRHRIAVPSTWNPAHLEVVGFVQDQRTGTVLQAVAARCNGLHF